MLQNGSNGLKIDQIEIGNENSNINLGNIFLNSLAKELEEFEVAQFQDQAIFVRILLPNQVYIRTHQNKLSQSITLNPIQWANSLKSIKKFLSHFYQFYRYFINFYRFLSTLRAWLRIYRYLSIIRGEKSFLLIIRFNNIPVPVQNW